MELKPFLLDKWLDTYEHRIEFNLAASTGPAWTLNEILGLASPEKREFFLNHIGSGRNNAIRFSCIHERLKVSID